MADYLSVAYRILYLSGGVPTAPKEIVDAFQIVCWWTEVHYELKEPDTAVF